MQIIIFNLAWKIVFLINFFHSFISFLLSVFLFSTEESGPVFEGVTNFTTFLLDRSSGMLYLGAKDAIVVVDTAKLSMKRKVNFSLMPIGCYKHGGGAKRASEKCKKSGEI